MKTLLIILIFLELVFALVAFTPFFINSDKTAQAMSQAETNVKNNPTSENEAALLSARAKLEWELWIEKIMFFGALIVLPAAQAVVIMMGLIFRRRKMRAFQT